MHIRKGLPLLFLLATAGAAAQQSLTLDSCEALFRRNNLQLLAAGYGVGMADAQIIQARIWDQPVLSAEFNAYNPERKKWLDAGSQGEKTIALQQLILLGGKRRQEVELARGNRDLALAGFESLLLSLRLQLQQNWYGMYYDQRKINHLSAQVSHIDSLASAYAQQAAKGNLPLKDVVRLQSLSAEMKNDIATLQRSIISQQQTLQLLLSEPGSVVPVADEAVMEARLSRRSLPDADSLERMALRHPDYRMARQQQTVSELNLRLQRALAVPDLTLGAGYEQRGGAFRNQVNIGVGIPLPFWNRNRGNILSAARAVDQAGALTAQTGLELRTRLQAALNNLHYQQGLYEQVSGSSNRETLETVYHGVLENFRRRNLSLIEFTDFMESYNQRILLINEMKKQVMLAGAELNYLVNTPLF